MLKNVRYKELQKLLMQLYQDGIVYAPKHFQSTPKVYFVVGPTGAGKSTFIYTLQGNKVTERQEEGTWASWSTSGQNNTNDIMETQDNKIGTGDLTLKKTIEVVTPKVATSAHGVTEGVKIYHTSK